MRILKTLGADRIMLGITMLAALAGCSTNLFETKSQPQVERVLAAADGPIEQAKASIDLYNAGVWTAKDLCAGEAIEIKVCDAALAASNAAEGAVAGTADLMAEALAWKEVYVNFQGSKDDPAYDRAMTTFQAATEQALKSWTQTKPRLEASWAIIGKVDRPVPE